MNFIKKHPYLFWELLGIFTVVIACALYVVFECIELEISTTITLIAMGEILIAPIIITLIKLISKSNKKYDKKIEEYKNSNDEFYGDDWVFNNMKKRANAAIVIGVIVSIPLLFLVIVGLVSQEWAMFGTCFLATIFLLAISIGLGMNMKKHPEKYINHYKAVYTNLTNYENDGRFTSDKSKWYWDTACALYCEQYNKDENNLTDDDVIAIWEYARNHIAFFLTWLIEKDFYCVEEEYEEEYLNDVKVRKITGSDYLTAYCDETITRYEISNKVIDFVDYYYNDKYINDYINFVENELNKKVYGITFNWEEYDKFKKIIDEEYNQYERNKLSEQEIE